MKSPETTSIIILDDACKSAGGKKQSMHKSKSIGTFKVDSQCRD